MNNCPLPAPQPFERFLYWLNFCHSKKRRSVFYTIHSTWAIKIYKNRPVVWVQLFPAAQLLVQILQKTVSHSPCTPLCKNNFQLHVYWNQALKIRTQISNLDFGGTFREVYIVETLVHRRQVDLIVGFRLRYKDCGRHSTEQLVEHCYCRSCTATLCTFQYYRCTVCVYVWAPEQCSCRL